MKEYSNLWFCQDCTIGECNADYSGMDDEMEARVKAGLSILGTHGHLAANFDSETGEGLHDFSSIVCDCCHTCAAGYRARFALFHKEPVKP